MDSTIRPGARWRNNSSNGDANSVQQVAQQYPPSSFEPQLSPRASGDSVLASDCFGAIGSELRGVPATFGVQPDLGAAASAPGQYVIPSFPPTGIMSGPEFASVAPYNGNGNNQTSDSLRFTEDELSVNATEMMRQLFSPTPIANPRNDRHRRAFTPTEADLTAALHKLGLSSNPSMIGDILDVAQRSLEKAAMKQELPSNHNAQQTPAFNVAYAEQFARPQPYTHDRVFSPTTNALGDRGGLAGPASRTVDFLDPIATAFSPSNRFSPEGYPAITTSLPLAHYSKEGRTAVIKSTNQIDPYLPEGRMAERLSSGADNRFCSWTATDCENKTNNEPSPVLSGHSHGSSQFPPPLTDLSSRSGGLSSIDHDNPNINHLGGTLLARHELMRREIFELRRQNQKYKQRSEHAINLAMRHITIREAEIASLKRQLRQEGIRPYNEPAVTDDGFYEKEMGMLFRMLCCWAKRFYKFPTGQQLPPALQFRVNQVCEDPHNEQYLMNSSQTKYLVIVALSVRWLIEEILNPRFLDEIAGTVMPLSPGEGLREVIEAAKDGNYDEKLYDALRDAADRRARHLLDFLHPLMSRPTDKSHREHTQKQFIGVAQHAARIILDTTKKDALPFFQFPLFGESYVADSMKDVTGDTLGLDVATKVTTAIWHELRGDVVRLCMLPLVTVGINEQNGSFTQTVAYKANVLLW